jgi:hypothetical protein
MTDLYTEILKFNKMNFDRDQLIEDYASLIVEGMDMDTLVSFAYDTLVGNLDSYNDAELIKEVAEYNPELLEQFDGIVPPVDVAQ